MNTNIPYIKQMDSDGNITNPIIDNYISEFPNRQERRKKEGRFYGNGNNHHISVTPTGKFRRVLQRITNKSNGKVKLIYHYI